MDLSFMFLHLYKCNKIISRPYNYVKSNFEGCVALNHEIEKKVGANIRNLREKAGLTQEQLAAKLQVNGCDITRSALGKIEVGQRHLYPDEIILIKKLLGTEYDDIFKL